MDFEFATASQIMFGKGKSNQIPEIWKSFGVKPVFIVGNSLHHHSSMNKIISNHKTLVVSHEPSTKFVQEALVQVRKSGCDVIISVGGGSVIDTGKALAAIVKNPGNLFDYLEVIGEGKPLENDPIPFIAVPTTAGTGSEVTKNAVIFSPEHKVKVSLRDNRMIPNVAIVDPVLTYSLPPAITAYTGMDALTQCLEPYVSHLANPLTDSICLAGMRRISRGLVRAYNNGDDTEAREDLALGSLFGGLALANAKLGAVHGFAGPIGGMFSAPHGAVCATLLAPVVEVNIRALSERNPDNPSLSKYDQIGRVITGNERFKSSDLIDWLKSTLQELSIPRLSDFGIKKSDFHLIVEKSIKSSSMKGNPISLKNVELLEILERAY
jgi:alcohol dehydrogenase class IV